VQKVYPVNLSNPKFPMPRRGEHTTAVVSQGVYPPGGVETISQSNSKEFWRRKMIITKKVAGEVDLNDGVACSSQ